MYIVYDHVSRTGSPWFFGELSTLIHAIHLTTRDLAMLFFIYMLQKTNVILLKNFVN